MASLFRCSASKLNHFDRADVTERPRRQRSPRSKRLLWLAGGRGRAGKRRTPRKGQLMKRKKGALINEDLAFGLTMDRWKGTHIACRNVHSLGMWRSRRERRKRRARRSSGRVLPRGPSGMVDELSSLDRASGLKLI
jgi:hypothetical protein